MTRLSSTFKVILIISFLTSLILGVSLYSKNLLSKSSSSLEKRVAEIEINTKAGDWKKADEMLLTLEEEWDGVKKTWAMLIDHIEIDNIEETLSRMSKYIESKEQALTLGEASALKLFIKHIPRKESFKLENIF